MEELTTTINNSAGYYNTSKADSFYYVGSKDSSGTTAGTYISYMCFPKPTITGSIKPLSMELKVYVKKDTSGYNGCNASVSYVGGEKSATVLHTFSGTYQLTEGSGGWRTYTTSTTIDRDYLKSILMDSTTTNIWLKLQRTSEQGVVIRGYDSSYIPTLTITYQEGNEIKYYTSGAWHDADAYVYTNGAWKPANIELYSNETWKS